jgi:hypothetical protein
MPYSRGTSNNVIVGAAAFFINDSTLTPSTLASQAVIDSSESYKETLTAAATYKQGMQVNLATAFAEATLENLLVALAYSDSKLTGNKNASTGQTLNLSAGDIGDVPVERGIVAVGPGSGDPLTFADKERIYAAYRALSIENVTVSAKRDEPSMFEVSFRLLPEDTSGSYGKIIDRTYGQS